MSYSLNLQVFILFDCDHSQFSIFLSLNQYQLLNLYSSNCMIINNNSKSLR